jgi:hypothetical protein
LILDLAGRAGPFVALPGDRQRSEREPGAGGMAPVCLAPDVRRADPRACAALESS